MRSVVAPRRSPPAAAAVEDTAAYLHWRRRLEEEHFVFNIPSDNNHRCDTAGSASVVAINSHLRLYGCTACGRFHRCLSDRARCPLVRAPGGTDSVCLFSGRVLCDMDATEAPIGTYNYEVAARSAARITESDLPWAHATRANTHTRLANVTADRPTRQRAFRKADQAHALQKALYSTRAHAAESQKEKRMNGLSPQQPPTKRRRLTQVRDSDVTALPVESYYDDDGGDVSGSDDEGGGGGTAADVGGHAVVFAPDETARDALFQRAYFMSIVDEVRAAFQSDSEANAAAGGGGGKKKEEKKEEEEEEIEKRLASTASIRAPFDHGSTQLIRRATASIVRALEEQCPNTDGRCIDARVDAFARILVHVLPHILPATMVHPSAGVARTSSLSGDIAVIVVAFLLDLLSEEMRSSDSFGNPLLIWRADPWLERCVRDGAAPAVSPSLTTAPMAASAPMTAGLRVNANGLLGDLLGTAKGGGRKRGRRTRDSVPVPPTARPRLVSQAAARLRAALTGLSLSPLALYSLVHSGTAS